MIPPSRDIEVPEEEINDMETKCLLFDKLEWSTVQR